MFLAKDIISRDPQRSRLATANVLSHVRLWPGRLLWPPLSTPDTTLFGQISAKPVGRP